MSVLRLRYGNGKTITGLNVTGEDNVGFFGVLAGTVKNVTFTNATVKGTGSCVGIVAGSVPLDVTATFEQITITNGEVSGHDYVGAMIGQTGTFTTISNCSVDGTTLTANVVHTNHPATDGTPVSSLLVGCNLSAEPTTTYISNEVKNVTLVIDLGAPEASSTQFEDALAVVNAESGKFTTATIKLAEGTYAATADDTFAITASNVSIEGAGADKSVINAGTYTRGDLGAFVVSGNNVTIKGVKITSENTNPNIPTLKVDGVEAAVTGFALENSEIVAGAGNAIELYNVNGAKISGVTLSNYSKCGIALGKSSVCISGEMTFNDADTGSWAEIGIMYKDDGTYDSASTVVIDFANTNFTAENLKATDDEHTNRSFTIYSERPASATADTIKNGTSESSVEVNSTSSVEGWTWSDTKGDDEAVLGWELKKDAE